MGKKSHRRWRQIVVCLAESPVLILGAVEGADDADTAELFAQDEVQAVGLFLRLVEHGHDLLCDKERYDENYRNGYEHDCREALVQRERHNSAADHDYRRADNNAYHHQHHVLYLADIVRRSGYQRGRSYLVDIALAQ